MTLKPFNDYDEHNVRNLFSLDSGAGTKGQLVKIVAPGFVNGTVFTAFTNINSNIPNVMFPRMNVPAKVTLSMPSDTQKPFGFMLYDTKEMGFDRPLIYDPVRLAEAQAVPSGYSIPICRKGMFLVGPWPSGVNPGPGSGVVAGNSGEWNASNLSGASATDAARCFGEFLGSVDRQGYALVDVNCFI